LKLNQVSMAAMLGTVPRKPPATVRMHSNPDFARASSFFQDAPAAPNSVRALTPREPPQVRNRISVHAFEAPSAANATRRVSPALLAAVAAVMVFAFVLALLAIRACMPGAG
jgi:hypothetical protein